MPQDIKTVEPEFGPTATPNQSDSRTWEQYLHNFLYQNGMFPDQAQAVLDSVRNDEPLNGLLSKAHDGYPPQMNAVLIPLIKSAAVKWIDANKPQAWFRAIFAD